MLTVKTPETLTAAAHGWLSVPATQRGGQSVTLSLTLVGVSLPPASHTTKSQGYTPCSYCPVQSSAASFKYAGRALGSRIWVCSYTLSNLPTVIFFFLSDNEKKVKEYRHCKQNV